MDEVCGWRGRCAFKVFDSINCGHDNDCLIRDGTILRIGILKAALVIPHRGFACVLIVTATSFSVVAVS